MLTNLATATIMIVFAGGPHTPERTALACKLLASSPPPAIIYLTGAEFRGEYSNLAARVRSIAAKLPGHPKVLTDDCTTTWSSCRHVARDMQTTTPSPFRGEGGGEGGHSGDNSQKSNVCGLWSMVSPTGALLVITSNYHAPRVRWLLTGVLTPPLKVCGLQSAVCGLTLLTTPDIPWREAFASHRNRQLILGECLSWLYCGPLGLIYRPWLIGLAVILMAGAAILGSNRKRGK